MKPAVAKFYWDRLEDPARVLDLGCGDGSLSAYKPKQCEIHGLELNPGLVGKLADYTTATIWDLDDDRPFPFPDGFFDAVVAKDILEHLQRPWRTVREIHRVMRPGGRVMASVICHRGRRTWSDYTHVRGFTEASARQLFIDGGFDVQSQWRMGGVPGSARFNLINLVPMLLSIQPFDWIWTSSYEIQAIKPRLALD